MSYNEELKCFMPIRYLPKIPSSNTTNSRPSTYSGELKNRGAFDIKDFLSRTASERKKNLENSVQRSSVISSKIIKNKYSLTGNSFSLKKKSLLSTNTSDISQVEPLNDEKSYILRSALKKSSDFKRPNQTVKRVLFSPKSSTNFSKCLSKSSTITKTNITENLAHPVQSTKKNLSIISESPQSKTDASTQTENEIPTILINNVNLNKIDVSIQTEDLVTPCFNNFSPKYRCAEEINSCETTFSDSLTCFENNEMLLATPGIKKIQNTSVDSICQMLKNTKFSSSKRQSVLDHSQNEENIKSVLRESLEKFKKMLNDTKMTIDYEMLKVNEYFNNSKKKIDDELINILNIEKKINESLDYESNELENKENIYLNPRRSLRLSASKQKTPKSKKNLRIEALKKSTALNNIVSLQYTPNSKKKHTKLNKSIKNYEKLKNIIPLETPKINEKLDRKVMFKTSNAQLSEKCFTQIQDLEKSS